MTDVTRRFSGRVDNYIKYRPGYPDQVLETLQLECGLNKNSIIADIGSGTGILTEIFLNNGNRVYGVEPNLEMRQAAERLLLHYPNFMSINGRAEATTLPDSSVDFITAGQAFHWFDKDRARIEFRRILKPDGFVVILWNERLTDSTPFLFEYELLLKRFGTDYHEIDHRLTGIEIMNAFYGEGGCSYRSFANVQKFDYEGLEGRLLSSSYVPDAEDPRYLPMLDELKRIFEEHQKRGLVDFEYRTQLYFGKLNR